MPLSSSELSLTEVKDKVPPLKRLDLGLMPLPDTACGLEWSSLVNAAKAYEGEETNKWKIYHPTTDFSFPQVLRSLKSPPATTTHLSSTVLCAKTAF